MFPVDGVAQGMEFSSKIKNIAAQEPFADLQDRLVGLAGIMENIAIERKSVMASEKRAFVMLTTSLIISSCCEYSVEVLTPLALVT